MMMVGWLWQVPQCLVWVAVARRCNLEKSHHDHDDNDDNSDDDDDFFPVIIIQMMTMMKLKISHY